MKMMRFSTALGAIACTLAIAGSTLPGVAATGTAWDSVTKFSMGGDTSTTPQPGNFATDFQTASQPMNQPAQRGGLFGAIAAAAGAGGQMMQMMSQGFAERHYVAGNMRRTDNLSFQSARLVDCSARTVTTMDLAKKTYRVTSLDAPPQPGAPRGQSRGGPMQDDGSKMDIKLVNTALGPKTIDGVNTSGFQSNITLTVTKPSGESQSIETLMTQYASPYAQPDEACPSSDPMAALMAGGGPPMMSMYRQMLTAIKNPNGSPRFTVSASGPQPPAGKLDLFLAVQPKTTGVPGFTMISENGNIHQVSDTDKSIFAVPADFTKES